MGLTTSKCTKCNVNKDWYIGSAQTQKSCRVHTYQNVSVCKHCNSKQYDEDEICCENKDFEIKKICLLCDKDYSSNTLDLCYHHFNHGYKY
jgi:hypothetical protein